MFRKNESHRQSSIFGNLNELPPSNKIVKTLAKRVESYGKEKMVIVGTVMRKLLQYAYGVLKTEIPFDPNYSANI